MQVRTSSKMLLILRGLKKRYEDHHKLRYTDEAIEAAVKLSVQYIGFLSAWTISKKTSPQSYCTEKMSRTSRAPQ